MDVRLTALRWMKGCVVCVIWRAGWQRSVMDVRSTALMGRDCVISWGLVRRLTPFKGA